MLKKRHIGRIDPSGRGGRCPETAGDARSCGRRCGRIVDPLFRGGRVCAPARRAAPAGGLHLRPRPDERGARSAHDAETALQPGADRLRGDRQRQHPLECRGAGAADGRPGGLDLETRGQAPHADLHAARDSPPALRGAGLRQLHAERGGGQGYGDSRRGGALLQVDPEGQPAADRRPVCLCTDHQVPQVDEGGQAAYARTAAGHA